MARTHLLLAADVAAHCLGINALVEQALHSPVAGNSPTVGRGPLQLQPQAGHTAPGPLATGLHAAYDAYGARCACQLLSQQI